MQLVAFWLMGILLLVLQSTLLHYLPGWLSRPDLTFILVAYAAYRFAWIPGIILSFCVGWFMDVVGAINLGFYPLMCLLVFSFLKLLTEKSPIKESMYQIPLVGLSYFLVQMLFLFIYSLALPEMIPDWSWTILLQRTAVVIASAIPLFMVFNALQEKVHKWQIRGKRPGRRRVRKAA